MGHSHFTTFQIQKFQIGNFDVEYSTGQTEQTDFENDKLIKSTSGDPPLLDSNRNDEITPEHFQSLTEKELILTFGSFLQHGKEAIVRNIFKVRELYIKYSKEQNFKLFFRGIIFQYFLFLF